MSRTEFIIDTTNYDCIFYKNRSCKALNKLYCSKNGSCSFYRTKQNYNKVPIVIENGIVKRATKRKSNIKI